VTASELDSYISRCVTYKEESRFDITSRCAAAAAATVFCYWSKTVIFLRYLCLLSTPKTLQVYRHRSIVGLHGRNFKAIDALVNLTRNNFKTKLRNLGFAKYSQKTFDVFAL
jgi:hypothetical protein